MKPQLLPTGEILHPIAVYENGMEGDGVGVCLPGSSDYAEWLADAEPADAKTARESADLVRAAHKTAKQKRQGG